METPTILGHEIVGQIEAFGPTTSQSDMAGTETAPGDRITWSIILACGACFYCHRELPQKCQRLFKYGHAAIDADRCTGGGLADFVVLKKGTTWLRVPDGVPNGVAAMANCAGATAAAAIRHAGGVRGQRVLVSGAGVLGVLTVAMASAKGARNVLAVDMQTESHDLALEFGATNWFNATNAGLAAAVFKATDGLGADVAFEMAGNSESVRSVMHLVRTGGTVLLAGTVSKCNAVSFDPQDFVLRMMTLRGLHNYLPCDLVMAMDTLTKNSHCSRLIAREFSLDDAADAFEYAHLATGARITVVP